MEARLRRSNGVVIVELRGKMAAGQGDELLRLNVEEQMAAGETAFLIDMRKVPAIDSSGVGELVATHIRVTRSGAQIRMLRPSPRVGDVLQMTQLQNLIPTYDDEESALRAFTDEGTE